MDLSWWSWCVQLGLASALVVGTIGSKGDRADAQSKITPDATLGGERSVVTPNVPIKDLPSDQIDGGATRGSSLFHSFSEFNVGEGGRVYFTNPAGIVNIFTRVTGNTLTNILGTLGVTGGNANLFVINPNGIIFGPNARLDVNGSFVATTASSLKFADGATFSATAPQAAPLLTISVPLGLQLGLQFGPSPAPIEVQGIGKGTRTKADLIDTNDALRVLPDRTLALVGGDLTLNGGTLKTAGGRIELGSVAGPSLVSLTPTAKGWSLGYEGVQNFQDIRLLNQATVDASGAGGGDILVRGRNVVLQDGSQMEASTLGAEPGGTLSVTASESVQAIGASTDGNYSSGLFVNVYQDATGSGGNLTINTNRLSIRDGGQVSSDTYGDGNAGTLGVHASDLVEVVGTSETGAISRLSADVNNNATGNGGDLTIDTRRLVVKDAQVSASTSGKGNAGDLTVHADDSVELSGEIPGNENGFPGGLFAQANAGSGKGGTLTIETGRLSVSDGSKVQVATFDQGDAGDLLIHASDSIDVFNTYRDSNFSTGIFGGSQIDNIFPIILKGNGGKVTIETNRLSIRDGGQVSSDTYGDGNAGTLGVHASDLVEVVGTSETGAISRLSADVNNNATGNGGDLTIDTRRLVVKDAQVSASTDGKGKAGDLTVHASDSIELSGVIFDPNGNPNKDFPAGLFAQADSGQGHGGNLNIETGHLSVSNGAKVQVATFDRGDAGKLSIHAKDIDIFETTQPKYTYYATGIFAGVQTVGVEKLETAQLPSGNGGNATINTNRLRVRDGGVVTSSTQGKGNAGSLQINATDSVEVFGTAPGAQFRAFNEPKNSEISAAATRDSTGSAGSLSIQTGQLIVRDMGSVSVKSEGTGQAGNLEINARSIKLDNQGTLTATTTTGNGGDINLIVRDLLLLRHGSDISTTAGTDVAGGNGGNITINTPSGFIVAVPKEDSDISANAFKGKGGTVNIKTSGIFGFQISPPQDTPLSDITASSDLGPQGIVTINTPDVDPSRGVFFLPTQVVDPSQKIASGCPAGDGTTGNSFTVTGRGGLPPSPEDILSSDVVWSDARLQGFSASKHPQPPVTAKPPSHPAAAITIAPATGWVFNNKGEVTLIAQAPNATPEIGSNRIKCHVSSK